VKKVEKSIRKRQLIFDQTGIDLFAKRFKEVRKGAGYTQTQLAFESGISLSQIARIETGKINTTVSTIFAVARAMEISPEEFFKIKL
jgi:transcriptional regulator with XRE-family HTH domain